MDRFRDVVSSEDAQAALALLAHLDATCRHIGVDYAMDGGTLVGSMLHHDRIPWDDDFDVYVNAADRARLTRALRGYGFVVSSNGRYSKLWSDHHPRVPNHRPWNWPFVDIGWLVNNATHTWEERSAEYRYRRHVYPREWIFPSVRRPFGPLLLSAPRNAARLLAQRFGPTWSHTCVVNHWDHRLERWRYRGVGKNTRAPCDAVPDTKLVRRRAYINGTSVEWLVRHGRAIADSTRVLANNSVVS